VGHPWPGGQYAQAETLVRMASVPVDILSGQGVGALLLKGQKEPAGHAVVVMVYDMPFPKKTGSLWKHSPICAP
jgi:hypothetical protein